MATESSAVVRFINLVQKDHQPIYSEGVREVPLDLRPRSGSGLKIAFGAVAIAGTAAIAGGFLVVNYFGSSPSSSSATPSPVAARAAQPVSTPVPATPPPAPQAAAGVVPGVADDAQIPAPIVSVPPDLLAETGFDIRVSPPATISVDAQVLGKAPLRVRNLQPGVHVVDIEAPAGFFSRRLEVDLVAGEPQNHKLELDPIEDELTAPAGSDADVDAAERPRSRRERTEERRKAKLAAREAKRAALAEAKRIAAERAELKREAARDEKERQRREAERREASVTAVRAQKGEKVAIKAEPLDQDAPPPASSTAPADDDGAPGTLMLGSKPLCDIYVNGKATGLKTPQRAMELSPGTYKIKLVNAELGIEKSFKVKIASGKTTRAIQDLTK